MKLTSELVNQITQFFDADIERLQTIFTVIYQNPELGFIETRISGIVAQEFKTLGFEGQTGILGIMKNGDGRSL